MPRKRTVSLSPKKARCRRPPPAARVCCKDCPTLASPFPSHSSTPSFTPHDTVHTSKTLPLRHTASPAVCPTREQPFRTTQSRNPHCTTIHALSPCSLVRALYYSIFTNKPANPPQRARSGVSQVSHAICTHMRLPCMHPCMQCTNAKAKKRQQTPACAYLRLAPHCPPRLFDFRGYRLSTKNKSVFWLCMQGVRQSEK